MCGAIPPHPIYVFMAWYLVTGTDVWGKCTASVFARKRKLKVSLRNWEVKHSSASYEPRFTY
jgi:hypothetical protein